jgi:class 3 adenylate cyclase/tetratricopeptide (TPR) repeat protein
MLYAQLPQDSLLNVWNDLERSDSLRADAYYLYIRDGFLQNRPVEALDHLDSLKNFAQEHELPFYVAKVALLKGNVYRFTGDMDMAIEYCDEAEQLFLNIGDNQGAAGAMINKGAIYRLQGQFAEALFQFQKGLEILEEMNENNYRCNALMNIGVIYGDIGLFRRSIEYYLQAHDCHESSGNEYARSMSLHNIAAGYEELGNYDNALSVARECLKLSKRIDHSFITARTYMNMGNTFLKLDEIDSAEFYIAKTYDLLGESGDVIARANTYYLMGLLASKKKDHLAQKSACEKALALDDEHGLLNQAEMACQCLYEAEKALGNELMAFHYLERTNLIADSLQKRQMEDELIRRDFEEAILRDSLAQVENERQMIQAHQEEVKKKNRSRNIAYASALALLILSGGLFSRWRYIRRSKAALEEEKDRSDSLLLNILPTEVAEELKAHGRASARQYDEVSILFTDFVRFTEISEKLDAGELVAELNECFEAFDLLLEENGIEKIKTIGDAYMAAGGLPIPSEDAVARTVVTALKMQEFMKHRIEADQNEKKEVFQMRLGIHTGPVVAGIVGLKKFQYDIWGDTVNTASRIESHGAVGKVNISDEVYERIKDDPRFRFESREEIEVKGKGRMKMWFVNFKN